jgi:hypothetical protein
LPELLQWTGDTVLEYRMAGLRSSLAAALLALLALAPGIGRAAAPDYAILEEALLQNVRNGYVDYDGLAANPKFAAFVAGLGTATAPTERGEALAFYINAYNALAIQGILEGYSPDSFFGRRRYFGSVKFPLAGARVTLEEIEKERLRPMGDPRIHFAIVCGSLSCPRLSNHAYLPATVDAQLDAAARRFVNDVTRNRFDIPQKTAFVSRIFDWYRGEFEAAAGGVPAYLARYVDEPATRATLLEGRLAVRYLEYDWALNGRFSGDATR